MLDAAVISRVWINSIIAGAPDDAHAPAAWLTWQSSGRRKPLIATRSIEYRSRREQMPADTEGEAIMQAVRNRHRPHAFEHCADAIARLMIPDIASLDVTRPSRDGGRDAVGQLRIGAGPGSILVDFALEAKCYSPPGSVGVRDMSRLLWLRWLEKDDARLVWLRANRTPWKPICWELGVSRATANRRWQYGIAVIVWRLNGKNVPRKRSMRFVVNGAP